MTVRFSTVAVVLAATVTATSAFAGSPTPAPAEPVLTPVTQAPVSFGPDWTGFYGGAELGYADTSGGGLNGDGVIGGLIAGYDFDLGNWVVGGGFDYDFADVDLGAAGTLEEVARLKLRGGYKLGNGLLYATGGAAWADTDNLGDDDGYFVGAGYEHRLSDQLSLGGELLYHEFDNFNSSGSDLEVTTAQARIAYRF